MARHLGRFSNAEAQAPLLAYLAEPVDTTSLVLVWEKSPEAGARLAALPPKLKKALEAAGAETIDHEPPARQREDWVGEQFSARGIKLDAAARKLVAEQLGEDAGAVVEVIERPSASTVPARSSTPTTSSRSSARPAACRPGSSPTPSTRATPRSPSTGCTA